MEDNILYKKMYLHLFSSVMGALELIESEPCRAKEVLILAQQECEEIYMDGDTP